MGHIVNDELEVHFSTATRIFMSFASIAFVAMFVSLAASEKITLLGRMTWGIAAVGFAALFIWVVRDFFSKRVLLVLDKKGLTDLRTKSSRFHIPWSEIKSANAYETRTWTFFSPRTAVNIVLVHPEKVIGQRTLGQWFAMMSMRYPTEAIGMGDAVSVFLFGLDVTTYELADAINDRLPRYRETQTGETPGEK